MNFHGRRLNVAGIVCKAVGAFEVGRQQVTMTSVVLFFLLLTFLIMVTAFPGRNVRKHFLK
jgi:hypothetical protein